MGIAFLSVSRRHNLQVPVSTWSWQHLQMSCSWFAYWDRCVAITRDCYSLIFPGRMFYKTSFHIYLPFTKLPWWGLPFFSFFVPSAQRNFLILMMLTLIIVFLWFMSLILRKMSLSNWAEPQLFLVLSSRRLWFWILHLNLWSTLHLSLGWVKDICLDTSFFF